jgi:mRNA interferase MazF
MQASYNGKTGLMVCCPISTKNWKIRCAKKKASVSADVMVHVRAKMKALLQIP